VSLDFISVSAEWHPNPSDGLSKVHACDKQTVDRQTTLRKINEY